MTKNLFDRIEKAKQLLDDRAKHIHQLFCANDKHNILDVSFDLNWGRPALNRWYTSEYEKEFPYNEILTAHYSLVIEHHMDYEDFDESSDRKTISLPEEVVFGTDDEIITWWLKYSSDLANSQEFEYLFRQANSVRSLDNSYIKLVLQEIDQGGKIDSWVEWEALNKRAYAKFVANKVENPQLELCL